MRSIRELPTGYDPRDVHTRVMAKTVFVDHIDFITPCYEFRGSNSGDGYGKIKVMGRSVYVHRVMFTIIRGKNRIPKGYVLDHKCKNRACWNPGHLVPVTCQENVNIGDAILFTKGRK